MMLRLMLVVCVTVPVCLRGDGLRLVEETRIPVGLGGLPAYLLAGDLNQDGSSDLAAHVLFPGIRRIGFACFCRADGGGYRVAYSDTGTANPQGIVTGNLRAYDTETVDPDSLPDVIGTNGYYDTHGVALLAVMHEPRMPHHYPDTMVWFSAYDSNVASSEKMRAEDLDCDGRCDVLFRDPRGNIRVFENAGDNENLDVYSHYIPEGSSRFAVGDFDVDGRTDFATAGVTNGGVTVLECTADNCYEVADAITVQRSNGHDVFEGADVDRSGAPEFLVSYASYRGSYWQFYLHLVEATGNDQYHSVLLDSVANRSPELDRWSVCTDLDGDGVEEVAWSVGTDVYVMGGVGPYLVERRYRWYNDYQQTTAIVNSEDVNGDGYPELLIGTDTAIVVLGLEAVEVLAPDGGEVYRPGDSVRVRWRRCDPPRCDSVSLFLSMHDGATFDTLVTGLPPTESSWVWVVPNSPSDSCRIRATVYGPGWRRDESDSAFRILPVGVEEEPGRLRRTFGLVVSPSPMRAGAFISFGSGKLGRPALSIHDVSGVLVRNLTGLVGTGQGCVRWDRCDDLGRPVAAGVYLVRFSSGAKSTVRKVVVE